MRVVVKNVELSGSGAEQYRQIRASSVPCAECLGKKSFRRKAKRCCE
jgi:hypothetical protein